MAGCKGGFLVLLVADAAARRAGPLLRASVLMAATGGQPGGRIGCCYKSSSYLESMSSVPVTPADREDAIALFRASIGERTLADTLAFADEHTTYVSRPFRVGDIVAGAGERAAAATVLSLGKLLRLTRAEAQAMHAGASECAQAEDREIFDMFAFTGWEGVHFPEGLSLQWR